MRLPRLDRDAIGIVGQILGAVLVGMGIGVELGTGADLGYVLITLGSLAYAVATKLRKV